MQDAVILLDYNSLTLWKVEGILAFVEGSVLET